MATDSGTSIDSALLGAHLRRLRAERGMRLEDLARRSGHTKGFLSKIENGKSSPSIATLMRLAESLSIDPSTFFRLNNGNRGGADPNATAHVTPGQRTQMAHASAGRGYAYWALAAPRVHKAMEPFLLTVRPEEADPARTFQHPGEEFIYVLEGRLDYKVGGEVFALEPGDSLYFDSSRPHAPHPKGGPATFLAIFHAPPRPLPRRERPTAPKRGRTRK